MANVVIDESRSCPFSIMTMPFRIAILFVFVLPTFACGLDLDGDEGASAAALAANVPEEPVDASVPEEPVDASVPEPSPVPVDASVPEPLPVPVDASVPEPSPVPVDAGVPEPSPVPVDAGVPELPDESLEG